MSRKPIIAGNWKLNKLTAEAKEFIEGLQKVVCNLDEKSLPEVVVAPVFTSLQTVSESLKGCDCIKLSAQNCSWEDNGAFTGEVSVAMLADVGCQYIIIGHSERREYFSETNEMINKKAKAVLAKNIIPIICCGETLEQREAGITDSHIETQIKAALEGISSDNVSISVIAYEPIWAIGTGKTCDSVEANRVIKMIRTVVEQVSGKQAADAVRILYGGSVKPDTIAEQMAQSDIDGALVGGASLTVDSFSKIVEGCMTVSV
jgi:triosephosphate isomerase